MKVHVEVTTDDIANGKRHMACECPLYLAIRRANVGDETDGFGVYRSKQWTGFSWMKVDLSAETPLPVVAEEFVRRFAVTFFLHPSAVPSQPTEVIAVHPSTVGPGYMVHVFEYDHILGRFDQAIPVPVDEVDSVRVQATIDMTTIPARDGFIAAWAR